MTNDPLARHLAAARRILGIARCTRCGTIIKVAEDDVFEAMEELRDEGWVADAPWDGHDDTALARWRCPACADDAA